MAQSVVLKGSEIKLYIGGKLYKQVQQIQLTIDYGETEIYGIDSQYAQEIVPTKVAVKGSVVGVIVKATGGLQGYNIRTRIHQILHGPYTALRIKDRHTDEDLYFVPQMKIVDETFSVQAKGVAKLSFNFKGIIPYQPLDMDGV